LSLKKNAKAGIHKTKQIIQAKQNQTNKTTKQNKLKRKQTNIKQSKATQPKTNKQLIIS
jgi:hypothetical protein